MIDMPALILGGIMVTSISGNGTVNLGDVLQIAPKSTAKAFHGGGGDNVGNFIQTNVLFSVTNTLDPSLKDASNIGNN
jgi:spore germination protein PF